MPWRRCPYCAERGEYPNKLVGDQVMCVACTDLKVSKTVVRKKGRGKARSPDFVDDVRKDIKAKEQDHA